MGKVKQHKPRKMAAFMILGVLLVLGLIAPILSVKAADGVNGNIEVGVSSIADGSTVEIRFYNLDPSSDYVINSSTVADISTFTTGATQTQRYMPITFDKPAATNDYILYLRANGTGAIIDQATLFIYEADTYIPMDLLLDIGIMVLILSVIIGAVTGIGIFVVRRFKK